MKNSVKHIWVLHTKTEIGVQKLVEDLIAKKIPEPEREFAVTTLRGGGGKANDESDFLLEQIMTLPLGCSVQLIVVYEYQKLINLSKLNKYIDTIPTNTLLVLFSSEKISVTDKKKLQSHPRVELVVEYFVRFEQIRNLLEQVAHKNEWKIGREVMEHLVKVFAENPQIMKKELEKLEIYFSPHARITLEGLEGILAVDQNEQVAYTVINAFFAKELSLTLKRFKHYLENHGDLNLLVALLIQELLLIVKFKELKQEGVGLSEIFSILGIKYDKPKLALQAKDALFKEKEIRSYLQHSWLMDQKLRQESLMSLEVDRPRVALNIKLELERLFVYSLV